MYVSRHFSHFACVALCPTVWKQGMYHILVTSGRTECIIHFHLGCCNRVYMCVCGSAAGNVPFLALNVWVCMRLCVRGESWHICVITWDWMCQVISTSVKKKLAEKRQAIWWVELDLSSSAQTVEWGWRGLHTGAYNGDMAKVEKPEE